MHLLSTAIGIIFILGGLFFFLIGTLGLLRFPDAVTRMHAAAKCDTLGVLLCLAGLAVFVGFNVTSLKLALIVIIVWVTNPTATHLIANAAYVSPKPKTDESEDAK
jgi:multicomponent Na+:H+ antiporter subunit G